MSTLKVNKIESKGSGADAENLEFAANGTTFVQLTTAGHVGIGTTAPNANSKLEIAGRLRIGDGSVALPALSFSDSGDYDTGIFRASGNVMGFSTGGSERLRIDTSGKVRIGCVNFGSSPGASNQGVELFNTNSGCVFAGGGTGTENHLNFFNTNGLVGKVSTNGSGTSYETSSDYRLKENNVLISDGIARLKTLKPYKFNFKADNSVTVDGFFAHEVTAVPEAISGEKDAMYPEVLYTADDELPEGKSIGDVKETTKIKPQGIDQSKLVPLLTAALQETLAKVEALEIRIEQLEG